MKNVKTFFLENPLSIMVTLMVLGWMFSAFVLTEKPFDKLVVCNYHGTIDTIKVPCKVAKTLEAGDRIGQVQQIWDFDMAPDHIGPWQFSNRIDTGMIQMNRFPGIVEEEIIAFDNYRIAAVVKVIE
jgi:hypothetical protein